MELHALSQTASLCTFDSVHIVQYHETSAVVPPLVALLHFRAQHKWLTMLALSPAVKMVKMGGYQYK